MNNLLLRNVARAWGIQPSYLNGQNEVVWAPQRTLLKVLQDLTETSLQNDRDLTELLHQRRERYLQEGLEKTLIFWNGKSRAFYFYLPLTAEPQLSLRIDLEDDRTSSKQDVEVRVLEKRRTKNHLRLKVHFDLTLPLGYHQLLVRSNGREFSSMIISAPSSLHTRPELEKSWGPFLPLYGLKTGSEWGIGSLKELTEATEVCSQYGAQWVSTLPLLAANFEPIDCDPSPYSALSRLFWNEIYLDVDGVIEKYDHREAREWVASVNFQKELEQLRTGEHVRYHEVYLQKKRVLHMIAQSFFKNGEQDKEAYLQFVSESPEINDYAKFRSHDLSEQNYHRFVQFEMHQSLKMLSQNKSAGLYMDFPVGVNDAGFDFKEFHSVFFKEVSVGAPPEAVFQLGQDWGFPAFHPFRHRAEGYNYFRKSLRAHLKFCKILRLDHVMGLYRVYIIPKGFNGREGVYLRFPPEDLFAIVILEAQRAQADFVGENLGTVPPLVDWTLRERHLNGMFVLQNEAALKASVVFESAPPNAMCSFNTHDMPMWATYVKTTDLATMRDLRILGETFYKDFVAERQKQLQGWKDHFGAENFTLRLFEKMAQCQGKYFVVTMEDLWNEEEPQNIPGTWKEYPNWRRKFALKIKDWESHAQARKILEILREHRSKPLPK